MSRVLYLDFLLGDLGCGDGRQQQRILVDGSRHPFVLVGRFRLEQRDVALQDLRSHRQFSGQLAQGFPGIIQQFLGIDLVADGEIVARLGIQGVGDRRQSHLEAFLCLLQGASDGDLV